MAISSMMRFEYNQNPIEIIVRVMMTDGLVLVTGGVVELDASG